MLIILSNLLTFLNDWLHGLMQMVMHMLFPSRWLSRLRFKLLLVSRVRKASSISLRLSFCSTILEVLAAMLSLFGIIVFLRKDFRVFERLDCGMIVVLMSFFFNIGLFAGFVLLFNVFVLYGRRNFRVYSGIFIAASSGSARCRGSG